MYKENNKPFLYELKEKYGDEQVLVINGCKVSFLDQGMNYTLADSNEAFLDSLSINSFYLPRYEVEYNPDYRQIIPYVIVKNGSLYFTMRRLTGAGETRLHNQVTIGIGGHINPIDNGDDIFDKSIRRELNEELIIPPSASGRLDFNGVINDMDNDVSRDHLGLLYTLELSTRDVTVRETNKYTGGFYTAELLSRQFDRMESWSQIVFEQHINGGAK